MRRVRIDASAVKGKFLGGKTGADFEHGIAQLVAWADSLYPIAIAGAQRGAGAYHARAQLNTLNAPRASRRGTRGANDTLQYLKSWGTAKHPTGITLYNTDGIKAEVIEVGRKPGAKQPPFDAIAAWFSRVAPDQAAELMDEGKFEDVIRIMRTHIQVRGLRARRVAQRTAPYMADHAAELIGDAIMREIKRVLR